MSIVRITDVEILGIPDYGDLQLRGFGPSVSIVQTEDRQLTAVVAYAIQSTLFGEGASRWDSDYLADRRGASNHFLVTVDTPEGVMRFRGSPKDRDRPELASMSVTSSDGQQLEMARFDRAIGYSRLSRDCDCFLFSSQRLQVAGQRDSQASKRLWSDLTDRILKTMGNEPPSPEQRAVKREIEPRWYRRMKEIGDFHHLVEEDLSEFAQLVNHLDSLVDEESATFQDIDRCREHVVELKAEQHWFSMLAQLRSLESEHKKAEQALENQEQRASKPKSTKEWSRKKKDLSRRREKCRILLSKAKSQRNRLRRATRRLAQSVTTRDVATLRGVLDEAPRFLAQSSAEAHRINETESLSARDHTPSEELFREWSENGLDADSWRQLQPVARRLARARREFRQARNRRSLESSSSVESAHTVDTTGYPSDEQECNDSTSDVASQVHQLRRRIQIGEHLAHLKSSHREVDATLQTLNETGHKKRVVPTMFNASAGIVGVILIVSGVYFREEQWSWLLFAVGITLSLAASLLQVFLARRQRHELTLLGNQRKELEGQIDRVVQECQSLDRHLNIAPDSLHTVLAQVEARFASLKASGRIETKPSATGATERDLRRARKRYRKTLQQWRTALAENGLPETLNPSKAKQLAIEKNQSQPERPSIAGHASNSDYDFLTEDARAKKQWCTLARQVLGSLGQPAASEEVTVLYTLVQEAWADFRQQKHRRKRAIRRLRQVRARIRRLLRIRSQLSMEYRQLQQERPSLAMFQSDMTQPGPDAETQDPNTPALGILRSELEKTPSLQRWLDHDTESVRDHASELANMIQSEQDRLVDLKRQSTTLRDEIAKYRRRLHSTSMSIANRFQTVQTRPEDPRGGEHDQSMGNRTDAEGSLARIHSMNNESETAGGILDDCGEFLKTLSGGTLRRVQITEQRNPRIQFDDNKWRSLRQLNAAHRRHVFVAMQLARVRHRSYKHPVLPIINVEPGRRKDLFPPNRWASLLRHGKWLGGQVIVITSDKSTLGLTRSIKATAVDIRPKRNTSTERTHPGTANDNSDVGRESQNASDSVLTEKRRPLPIEEEFPDWWPD